MNSSTHDFLKLIRHPVKFRLFLLSKLPAAFFSGVRIKKITEENCTVTIPYKWLTRNPFRSAYFASLSMAAEMSTGALAMAHVYKRTPAVSMLVVKTEAEYFKKATGKTVFVCEDGWKIKQTIEQAVKTNEAKIFRARSIGKNEKGEVVAEFYITWSFKSKS